MEHPIQTSKNIHADRYDAIFHFFLAKSINDICQQVHTHEYLLIKQYSYFDNDNQYLKRYYVDDEVEQRIQLLADLYSKQKALKLQNPRICSREMQKYLDKRIHRIKKVEKKLMEIQLQQLQSFESSFLNENINITSKHQQKNSLEEMDSLDSSVYDIFQSYEELDNDYGEKATQCVKETLDLFVEKVPKNEQIVNHLIIDFDDLDTQKVLTDYNKIKQKEENAKKRKIEKIDSKISAKMKKQKLNKITKPINEKLNRNFSNIENKDKNLLLNTLRNPISTISSYHLNDYISQVNEIQQNQQCSGKFGRNFKEKGKVINNLPKKDLLLAQIQQKYAILMSRKHNKEKNSIQNNRINEQNNLIHKNNKGIEQYDQNLKYTQKGEDEQFFFEKNDYNSNNINKEHDISVIKQRAKILLGIQRSSEYEMNFFRKKN